MTESSSPPTEVPPSIQEGLERFCTELRNSLGEDLVSVVLYGDVVTGEYSPRSSDVSVMLVVREATVEAMDRTVPAIHRGMCDSRLSVMMLTQEDLRGSADVFPTKFLEMQQRHRVLWGEDVLSGLAIARDHLRLRCEQEIKNLLLRLRRFYLHRAHRPELVAETLMGAVAPFVASLGVLLLLKNGAAPSGRAAVVECAAREFGLEARAIEETLALRSGAALPDGDSLKRLYDAFMTAVAQAAEAADRL